MPLQDYLPDVMAYQYKGATTELWLYSNGVQNFSEENPVAGIAYRFFLHGKREANWSGTFLYDVYQFGQEGTFSGSVYYYQQNGDIRESHIAGGNITVMQRGYLVDVWFETIDNYNHRHKHHYWYKNGQCETTHNSSAIVALSVDEMLSQIAYSTSGVEAVPMMVKGVVKEVTDDFFFKITLEDGKETLPCYDLLGFYRSDSTRLLYTETYSDMYHPGDTVFVVAHRYHDPYELQTRYGFVYKHYPQDESKMNFMPSNFKVSTSYGRADYTWSANDGYSWEVSSSWEYNTHYTDKPRFSGFTNITEENSSSTGSIRVRAVDEHGNPKSEWSNDISYEINGENPYAIQDLEHEEEDGIQHFYWNWDKVPDDFEIRLWNNNTNKLLTLTYGELLGSVVKNVDLSLIIDIPGSYHLELYPIVNGSKVALETIDFYSYSGTNYTPYGLTMEIDKDKINCSWTSSADFYEVKLYHHGTEVAYQYTKVPYATFTPDADGAYSFSVEAHKDYTGKIQRSVGTGVYRSETEWFFYHRFFKWENETKDTHKKNDGIYYGTRDKDCGCVLGMTSYGFYATTTGEKLLREGCSHVMLFAQDATCWDRFNQWENGLRSQGRVFLPMKKQHLDGRFYPIKKYHLSVLSGEGGSVYTWNRYGQKRHFYGGWYPAGSLTEVFWAEASNGYHFSHWTDRSEERKNIARRIEMNNMYSMISLFTKDTDDSGGGGGQTGQVELKVQTSNGKMGTVNEEVNGKYDIGSQVTIMATAKENYRFAFWDNGDPSEVGKATRTITLTQDTSFIAFFAPDSVDITVKSNNEAFGTVNKDINGRYPKGTILTLEATPTDSTTLTRWSNGELNLKWKIKLTQDSILTAYFELLKNINYTPYDLWAWRLPKEYNTEYGGHVWSGNIDMGWSAKTRAPEYEVMMWYMFTNPETQKDDAAEAYVWYTDTLALNIMLNEDSIWTYTVQAGRWDEVYDEEANEYVPQWVSLSDYVWYYPGLFFTRQDTIHPRNMTVTTEDSCTYHFAWNIKYQTTPTAFAIDLFTSEDQLIKSDTIFAPSYSYTFARRDSISWRVRTLFQQTETQFVNLTYQYGPKFYTNPKEKNFDPTNMQASFANDTLQLCWEGEAPHYLVELIYAEGKANEYSFVEFTDEHCIRFPIYDRGEYDWYVYPLDEVYAYLSEEYFHETFNVDQTSHVQYELVVEDDGWCTVNDADVNGMYEPYTLVTVVADLPEGNAFLGWSDGNLSNPRTIVMTEDTYIQVITQWGEDEKAESKTFTVRFYDWDDTLLKTQKVKKGQNATPPTDPERKGYKFIGWDNDYTNITKDMDIYAQYKKIEEALDNISAIIAPIKILRNGQIYIIRGEKTYTIQGQEIK